MSDFNSAKNRLVWFDIPVADLDRATAFYAAVLDIPVHQQQFGNFALAVLDHQEGNGGCLVPNKAEISSDRGVLIYLNVDKRIKDAVDKVERNGGKVVEPTHAIGPHGFRAIVRDSEGNRIALHSTSDT
jgi:predicted enzyme related to lactoylglutathione lyase